MKKEVSPTILAIGLVVALAIVGGMFYATLGAGAGRSKVASPYGIPTSAADFQRPKPTGSGINAITGERLPETATRTATVPTELSIGAPQRSEPPKTTSPK